MWRMVAKRLELSEDKIARRIDVWGADWLDQPDQAVDRQRVLDDLTATGTPYWRLKKVMDAWCALWFWPLDKVAELDGTARAYEVGGGVVSEADLAALLGGAPVSRATEADAPEPTDGPAPGDQGWEKVSLFGEPVEEEQKQRSSSGQRRGGSRQTRIPTNRWRDTIPLKTLADWLDFLDCLLGTHEVPEGSFLDAVEDLDVLTTYEKDLVAVLGMDEAQHLSGRFPWLGVVETIAGSTEKDIQAEDGHGFFHWELHFAHVFRGKGGGFDLQVGNPPWVRPKWEENAALGEHEPWFMLTEKPLRAERARRVDELLAFATVRSSLLNELASLAGTVGILGSEQMYPLLKGQPDLYRAFMCTTWTHTGHNGTVGLIHPDSHFSGDREMKLREAAYERLLVHGDFANASNRFFPPPIGHASHFGVHVYGRAGEIGFDHLSWLFSVDALRLSANDDGTAPDPGVRVSNSWDERPHRKRIIRVTEETLAEWQRLTGDEDQPVRQARLLSPVSTAEAQAIEALADYPLRLGSSPQISSGYHESGDKALGLIEYNLPDEQGDRFLPTEWPQVILKGPQLGLGNPLFKQPSQGASELLGLDPQKISDDAVPETEYVRAANEDGYKDVQDPWIDHRWLADLRRSETAIGLARLTVAESRLVAGESVTDGEVDECLTEWARRPYTDFYRVAWREFIAPDTERSLYATLLPPGAAHVHAIRSAARSSNRDTVLTVGFWAGIPIDYLLRTTRVRHLDVKPARRLPVPSTTHPLASALLLRALRLNCLTSAYAKLWEELYEPTWSAYEPWANPWPDLQPLHDVTPTWRRATPLRSERARRMALVEIDALVAVWLGVTADALVAMYKARFPIMQDFDAVTWFDAKERKIAGDRHTYGFGQTKEHYTHLLAFNKGERTEPPEGYTAPFYKADREAEMRAAHAYFTQRMKDA